jgi:predicted Fe-Mo cluster-binding NifX family protein
MRIALSCWQNRISPVFDVADSLMLIDLEGARENKRRGIALNSRDPFRRVKEIADLGVELMICGAISQALEAALRGAGVQVSGFIRGDLETVVRAFVDGQLHNARFRMPGCRKAGPDRTNPSRAAQRGNRGDAGLERKPLLSKPVA